MPLKSSAVLVRALERDGFVTRSVKPADPRAVELALTERGAAAVEEGVNAVYELRERLTRPLGGNDGTRTAELAAMLRDLLDAAEPDPIPPPNLNSTDVPSGTP